MAHVLIVAAIELGSPMAFVIGVKSDDLSFHSYADPLLRRPAGFHQRNIVSAMSQEMPDAMTSGSK